MTEHDWEQPEIDPLDRAIVTCVAATVLFAAVSLGAVQAWSEEAVLLAGAAIAALAAARVWRDGGASAPGWATAMPVALFVGIVVLQLVPLPAGVAAALSPGAARLRADLLSDLPGAPALLDAPATVSLYAEAGWKHLRMLLVAAAVFFACASVARRRAARRALLVSLTLVGGAIACVALAHQALGVAAIWGAFKAPLGPTRAAPFINHSHFAQFMNLSLGCALAVALPAAAEFRRDRRPQGPGDWLDGLRQGQLVRLPVALACAGLVTLGLALSGSRGGLISLAAAAALTAVVSAIAGSRGNGGSSRWTAPGILMAVVLIVLAAYASSEHVGRRVEQLAQPGSSGERLTILRSLLPAWQAFPVLGTGLGTFEFVYPMYDQTTAINLYTHAENEYAQVLTETGAVGLALVLWFVAAAWVAYARCVRRGGRLSQLALGLGFGFAAILVHSASDFGQHIPANAMLTAAVLGLLVGLARRTRADAGLAAATTAPPPNRGVTAAAALAVAPAALACAGMLLLIPQADACRRAEAAYAVGKRLSDGLAYRGWEGTDREFSAAIARLTEAGRARPGNVVYRYDLNVLRFYSLARNPEGILPVGDRTSPATVPAATVPNATTGPAPMTGEQVREYIRLILAELNAARVICPTYGPAQSMAGHALRKLGFEAEGVALLTRAASMTSYDGVTLLFSAEGAMARGEVERAKRLFRRSAQLRGTDMQQVIRRFVTEYRRPAEALELAADDPHLLGVAGEALRAAGEAELAAEARGRYAAALRRAADGPDASAGTMYQLSRVLGEQGDRAGATDFLRRAVFRRPEEARWRLELARLLAEQGDYAGAVEQAEAALRYRPDWPEADRAAAEYRSRAATRPAG